MIWLLSSTNPSCTSAWLMPPRPPGAEKTANFSFLLKVRNH
jgi:hypothetical protein